MAVDRTSPDLVVLTVDGQPADDFVNVQGMVTAELSVNGDKATVTNIWLVPYDAALELVVGLSAGETASFPVVVPGL